MIVSIMTRKNPRVTQPPYLPIPPAVAGCQGPPSSAGGCVGTPTGLTLNFGTVQNSVLFIFDGRGGNFDPTFANRKGLLGHNLKPILKPDLKKDVKIDLYQKLS
jgi:hypothetical protein